MSDESTGASVALAITFHDPEGRMRDQIERALPTLGRIFATIVVQASPTANQSCLDRFAAAGARIAREDDPRSDEVRRTSQGRRATVANAIETDAPFLMYCDGDRVLHWVERYPEELAAVVRHLPEKDFTILGRTPRAFDSHPRIQRDTEAIINHVFGVVTGRSWDVTAAARGMSRRTAEAIVAHCPDGGIATDVVWPLHLLHAGGFTLGYVATEGLEFETGDRYPDQIAAAGGYDRWLAQLDADPRRWAHRLDAARIEVEAMVPFTG